MQPQELEKAITKAVAVTSQKVLIAKRFLMKEHSQSQLPDQILNIFLSRMEATLPKEITINASADFDAIIKSISDSLSWHIAFDEALWQLMSANFFLPCDGTARSHDPYVNYFQGQGGSGSRSGFSFGQFRIWLPQQIRATRLRDEEQPLSSPDLYLTNLDIPGLHADVELSLREAVQCFRNELFLAAAVMVGRASEIAWSELAAVFAARDLPGGKGLADDSIATKIRVLIKLCESEKGKVLLKERGVAISEIRDASVWAHSVRDARNSIHYGVAAAVENDYETVAVLLLSAVPNLRLVYKLMRAV